MNGRYTLRKHSITLVEVLISLTLLTLLLSSLFFWYHHLTEKKSELEKLKRPYVEERYVWQRLEQIIPKSKLPFFTDDGLVFRFDRGLCYDPRLSDMVLGKLYHDPNLRTLCLGIWPDPKEEALKDPSLTLTLLDHVDTLSFQFYSPPPPFQKPVDPEQVGKPRPKEGWQDAWGYDTLPALVRVTVTHEGEKREMYFDLDQPIIYPVNG